MQDAAGQSQKDMATFAGWMLIVAGVEAGILFVGVLLVGYTLAAARQAVKAVEETVKETRRIGEAQTRSYLHAGEGKFALVGDHFDASLVLKNTGRSPATNICIAGTLGIYHSDKLLASIDFDSRKAQPIAAETEGTVLFEAPKLPEFGGADVARHLQFRVQCEVSWDDVFGKAQELPLSFLASEGRLMAANRNPSKDFGAA